MEALDRTGKKAFDAGILMYLQKVRFFINWPRPDPAGRRNAQQMLWMIYQFKMLLRFPTGL
jgi:hypothetical protein